MSELSKKIQGHQGMFCGNFLYQRGGFKPCLGVWYHSCYIEDPDLIFPFQTIMYEEGFLMVEEDEEAYTYSRVGYQYMNMLQCEV